jgi:hypothetical protein
MKSSDRIGLDQNSFYHAPQLFAHAWKSVDRQIVNLFVRSVPTVHNVGNDPLCVSYIMYVYVYILCFWC